MTTQNDAGSSMTTQDDSSLSKLSLCSHDVDLEQHKIEYDMPIIKISMMSYFDGLRYQRDFNVVRDNLYYFNPAIRGINMSNLVIAGGAVTHALYTNQLSHSNGSGYWFDSKAVGDIDFFVYGLSSLQEVSNRVKQLYREICLNILNILGSGTEISITKKLNSINIKTLHQPYIDQGPYNVPIQIICHNYGSIEDILNTFDIQCCKCAFTGTGVLMTQDALTSHATKTIVLDLPKTKFTYEHRIAKYMNRGYGLVVKDLDYQKVQAYCDVRSNALASGDITAISETYSTKLQRISFGYVVVEDEGIFVACGVNANYKMPENLYGPSITVPIISARKKHTMTESFEVRGRVSDREILLHAVEAKSIIRPLEYYYGLFSLEAAHLADTADNLGLSKEEFQTFKNTANIQNIPLAGLLKGLVDEKLPRIKQVYDDCLSRLVICDNIIWDVTGCSIKIPTAKEWYGNYYKSCSSYEEMIISLSKSKIVTSEPVV
jgi:hypothetical protein